MIIEIGGIHDEIHLKTS